MSKRKLIFEDETYPAHLRKNLKAFEPHLNKIKEAFDSLEYEPFSNEILTELITQGVGDLQERCKEKSLQELSKAGITNSVIKNQVVEGITEKVNNLQNALREYRNFFPPRGVYETRRDLRHEDVSFLNGEFTISEADLDKLMEGSGRVYLETEQEHELYGCLNDLLNSFEKVQDILRDAKYTPRTSMSLLEKDLLKRSEEGYRINPAAVKWVLTHYNRMQTFRSA